MFLRRRPAGPPVSRRIPFEGATLVATPHAGAVDDEAAAFLAHAWPVLAAMAHEGCREAGAGLVRVPGETVADPPPVLALAPHLGFVPAHHLSASPFAPRPHPAMRTAPDPVAAWLVEACERYDVATTAVVRLDRPRGALGLTVASRTLPPPAAAARIRAIFN